MSLVYSNIIIIIIIIIIIQIDSKKMRNTTRFSIFIRPFLIKSTVCLQTANCHDGD